MNHDSERKSHRVGGYGVNQILLNCAQAIAETTHSIIGYDVLITDESGLIIGTNEPQRLRTRHAHSLDVIQKGVAETRDEAQAEALGVRHGVCLPIRLGTQIVGTVAIAGNPDDVVKYGHLAQKEAELFLREKLNQQASLLRENVLSNLVSQLVSADTRNDTPSSSYLSSQAKSLGFELALPRSALIVDICDFERIVKTIQNEEIHNYDAELRVQTVKSSLLILIREIFNDPQDIVSNIGSDKFIILANMRNKSDDTLKKQSGQLQKSLIQNKYHVLIGIGNRTQNHDELKQSVRNAWCSINIGKKLKNQQAFYSIDSLDLEDFFLSADRQKAAALTDKILSPFFCSTLWNQDLEQTLREWVCTPHPASVSERLGIHRNSLLYRIHRISEISGVDLKDSQTLFRLRIALLLHDLIKVVV